MGIVASTSKTVRPTTAKWQLALKTAIRSGVALCQRLELPSEFQARASRAEQAFPVFAPLDYVAKMRRGDPHDPLLRQVLPLGDEVVAVDGFSTDPVGDEAARVSPGILQKYKGRVLVVATGACAIHCRYCFRRHFPYQDSPPLDARWEALRGHVAEDASIEEVILSGGDPLTLGDDTLAELASRLASVPHLRRLRIHSRLPIVVPDRVTSELIAWMNGTRLVPMMVVHANHPRELDDSVGEALERLVDAGIPVLNQSVLLRGVNDDATALVELSRRLLDHRVLPYYLHQLDRVAGAGHFEVPVKRGLELMDQLRTELPGFAVPRYVQEVPGDAGKAWLFRSMIDG